MSMSTMEARVQYLGGDNLGRLNKQKLQSFKSALKNDYNRKTISTPHKGAWPCLINTNSLKPDYDTKILSVEFNSSLTTGDVFEVLGEGTHWMVYLPDLVETAYLKTEIIRCRYSIEVNGQKYWIYFKGPTENKIDWKSKDLLQYNTLNLSGMVYVKSDDNTKSFFKRFTKFKVEDHTWQCEAVDSISVPGVLEIAIKEYFDDEIAELPEVIKESTQTGATIIGKKVVHQGDIVGYSINKSVMKESYSWKITGNTHVRIEKISSDGSICTVKVLDGAVKTFNIEYGPYLINVTIDITESIIKGPSVVYPYDNVTYVVKYPDTYDEDGNPVIVPVGPCFFSINNDCAKIVKTDVNSCVVEITSGKSGKFNLSVTTDGKTNVLPVIIKSL